jgi:uncharacterized repeat protein (TIGR01451 family)
MKTTTSSLVLSAIVIAISGCAGPMGRSAATPTAQATGATAPIERQMRREPIAYHSPPVQPSPIAQVAYNAYNAPTSCGCSSCGTAQCAPQAPHGYAVQPNCGWNTYGTDPQEFLCDGGDYDSNARLRLDDTIAGLDPEDTIVHYTTEAGDIEIEASNRVCLYAPRFGSVRRVTGAIAGGRAVTASQVDLPQGPISYEHELPGLVVTDTTELAHADVSRRVDAMRERNRGVPVEGILQPEQADDVLAVLATILPLNLYEIQDEQKALLEELALAAVTWTLDEAVEVAIEDLKPPTLTRDENVAGLTVYEFPDAGRLRICKLADRQHAQPGEIVNFSLQVVNVGDRPVDHVTITDNLTTRLEYVADSQTCSAGAEFETLENDSESLQLIWRLTDSLKVGETATMRFRCKVR